MKLILITLLLFGTSLGVGTISQPAANPPNNNTVQDQDDDDVKKKLRQVFMRGKLKSNQKIVEGLSTNNFKLIAEGADDVTTLLKGEHWFVIDTKQYRVHSDEFKTAAVRLKAAAEKKNIEGATLRYFELTMSCVDCHQYYIENFVDK
jgi:cytochrome c556